MTKVLHIIDSLGRGGAENILVQSINKFVEKYPGYQHYIITAYAGGDLSHKVSTKVPIFCLNLSRYNFVYKILFLRRFINNNKIDLIHSHLIDSTLLSRASIPSSVNLVSTYHSPLYDSTKVNYSSWRLWLDRISYRDKFYLIFVSDFVRNNICKKLKTKEKLKVVHNYPSNSFELKYQYSSKKSLKAVAVGNLKEVKNHLLAVKALTKLKDCPITLDIYGEGHLHHFLINEIQQNGAKITLKGKVEITSELLSKYDLFLMTSSYEGMPVSLIEAMRTGLPALLPQLQSLVETAGDTALYYAPDDQENLSEMLSRILKNKSVLQRLSAAAFERSKRYSIERYLSSIKSIYESFSLN